MDLDPYEIKRAYELKQEIAERKKELAAIQKAIAESIDFNGKRSGQLLGSGVLAKVQLKDNITYDQDKITETIKANLEAIPAGESSNVWQAFNWCLNHFDGTPLECFGITWKPDGRSINAWIKKDPKFAAGVEWMREVKPAPPYVRYELVEEEVADVS